jgi:GxxExxY protein
MAEVFLSVRLDSDEAEGRVKVEVRSVTRRDITPQIIGAAIKVHRKLGPGLLESAYEACLAYELEQVGFHVQRQRAVPLIYGTVKLECGFRADLIVNGEVVVEIKCKEALHPVDQAQLLSHLRLLDLRVGLLINFHVVLLKDGIKRMVNRYEEPAEEAGALVAASKSF